MTICRCYFDLIFFIFLKILSGLILPIFKPDCNSISTWMFRRMGMFRHVAKTLHQDDVFLP